MTDYRSESEKFVTAFLDYVYEYDIKDKLNKQTQRMERSPGVQVLVNMAEDIFPTRKDKGVAAAEMRALPVEEVDEAIAQSPNVIDTRAMFAAKISENGGLRNLAMQMADGDDEAFQLLIQYGLAEKGKKEFSEDLPK